MAYYYNQPMGYTPMYQPQYQQYQQAQAQLANGSPVQPQYQPPQAQSVGVIWVDGYEGAAAFPVAPNAAVILRDKSDPRLLYLRWADATGKPDMTIYAERKELPKQEQPAEARYATVEALERLAGIVEGINGRVEELRLKSRSTAFNEEADKDGC